MLNDCCLFVLLRFVSLLLFVDPSKMLPQQQQQVASKAKRL
jgi:hypothetical protein